MAINESILGEALKSNLKPLAKYFLLTKAMGKVNKNWVKAKIKAFSVPLKMGGKYQPNICPIER
ncbi:MAG: hypothetical protein BWZ05_02366 [Bacteroidetes bacterium ADurb.BinA245]|nr:MAG: hypothetical protein BWZ05_02366 [Bacteroidetes bacterium ADurb.BinA245]